MLYLDDEKSGLENVAIIDTITGDLDVEKEIVGELSDKVVNYLNSLSPKQSEFIHLVMQGYNVGEAGEAMGLSKSKLDNMLKILRCYEKKQLLSGNKVLVSTQRGDATMSYSTNEKSKTTKCSVAELERNMADRTLNLNHPLQRPSGQWDNKTKSNLISDILQDNPIPALIFAEQVIDGLSIKFDLDGKQRCTTIREFLNDGFKISKNVSRAIIKYQAAIKDEKGETIINEKGYPIMEWVEYDITNKKYSQLPIELQNKIKQYNFDVTLYLNCSETEIAYHIQRYNQGKPMSVIQKGFTHLGEDFAREVKAITAMPLFQDSGFTFRQFNRGDVNRIIIESVMAINFLNDWKKSPEEISIYLNKNANIKMFEDIEESIERLQKVLTDETITLFDIKNTFLWLILFDKFKKYDIEDIQFNEFLECFIDELQYTKINGETFNSIDAGKNTKDKSVLIKKIDHLTILMKNFLFPANDLAS